MQAPREALALQANQLPPHSGEGDVSRCYASLDRTLDELFGTGDQMPIDTVKAVSQAPSLFVPSFSLSMLVVSLRIKPLMFVFFLEEAKEAVSGEPLPRSPSDPLAICVRRRSIGEPRGSTATTSDV